MLIEVDKTIQTNGYFTHSENILLAMLVDECQAVRIRAVEKILDIRKKSINDSTPKTIRQFIIPPINFKAKNYTELIDWNNCTEPPLTQKLNMEDLNKFRDNCLKELDIFKFLCHTQDVERHVKLITECSGKVCDNDDKEKLVKSIILSREIMPKFNTKKEF